MTLLLWLLLAPVVVATVSFLAGRLLGARRGWVALLTAGIAGSATAVVAAGELTGWEWSTLDMMLLALGFAVLFTMTFALAIDLLAPVGTLATGEAAGLVTVRNPVEGVRSTLEPFRRYREVIHLAREHGVVGRHVTADDLPTGVRRTLEDAGGIFVKLGQVASTRSDVLPPAWCEELAQLRSAAAPAPEQVMRPHLTEQLGGDPDELYAEFDWTPIASASIAQVYRARLHDGRDVVVKAQRPGLTAVVTRDRAAVMQLARLIERRTVLGLAVRPAELAAEFLDGVAEELDFRIEAANAAALAAGLAGVDGVAVPAVIADRSGQQVLTEELVTGTRLGVWAAGTHDGAERRALADRLIRLFLHQIFTVGVYHADPHPGNLILRDDGTIVMIDLGAVGRLSQGQRTMVLDLLTATASGDAPSLRRAVVAATTLDRSLDQAELEAALDDFLGRHARPGGGIDASALQHLAVLVGRFGIRLPRWFGTLSRTFVTLEGTLRGIDPDFSLVDAVREQAGQIAGPRSAGGVREMLEHEAMLQLPRLRRLPEHVDELLGQAAAGRLTARVSVLADRHDERVVTRLVDRVVLGMIASAVGVSSVLLLGVESGPELGETVTLNEVLGYVGLGTSVVLAMRVVAGIIRDGEI